MATQPNTGNDIQYNAFIGSHPNAMHSVNRWHPSTAAVPNSLTQDQVDPIMQRSNGSVWITGDRQLQHSHHAAFLQQNGQFIPQNGRTRSIYERFPSRRIRADPVQNAWNEPIETLPVIPLMSAGGFTMVPMSRPYPYASGAAVPAHYVPIHHGVNMVPNPPLNFPLNATGHPLQDRAVPFQLNGHPNTMNAASNCHFGVQSGIAKNNLRANPQNTFSNGLRSESQNRLNTKTEQKAAEDNTGTVPSYRVDSDGYICFTSGLVLCGRYRVQRRLGKGAFSRVFECVTLNHNTGRNEKYAVKVIRNGRRFRYAVITELFILRTIRHHDPDDSSCCIHVVAHDDHHGDPKKPGHPIIVFPLLSQSIYSFMQSNKCRPFSYDDTIDILRQICRGVAFMRSVNVINTDLKPDNIMFVDDEVDGVTLHSSIFSTRGSTKIKIIDFGSAVLCPPGKKHSHLIQTRPYRAPEVILNMKWDFSADIWSVGCILVELLYGRMLFATLCSIDHLNQMRKCLGSIPQEMLSRIDDETRSKFFDVDGNINMDQAIKSPIQCRELMDYFTMYREINCFDRIGDLRGALLLDLCSKMLRWDPSERITIDQALDHPVFYLQRK